MLNFRIPLMGVIIIAMAITGCTRSLSQTPAVPIALVTSSPQSPSLGTPAAAINGSATLVPPTLKPPTATIPPKPTSTSAKLNTPPSGAQTVKIFLIAVNDGGKSGDKIGCGDSVVAVRAPIAPTLGVLRASYEKLLSMKSQYYGVAGLYNALYQSNLKLDDLALINGEAIIHLSGKLAMGGECDNPRIQAQLEDTALQFSTVQKSTIYINNKLLKDVLTLK